MPRQDKPDVPSTPVSNFYHVLTAHTQFLYMDWVRGYYRHPNLEEDGVPLPPYGIQPDEQDSIKYVKRILGPQAYCRTYANKCWVWEDLAAGWRLYVSKRGRSLEVFLPDLDWQDRGKHAREVAASIKAFLAVWEKE